MARTAEWQPRMGPSRFEVERRSGHGSPFWSMPPNLRCPFAGLALTLRGCRCGKDKPGKMLAWPVGSVCWHKFPAASVRYRAVGYLGYCTA